LILTLALVLYFDVCTKLHISLTLIYNIDPTRQFVAAWF